MVKEWSVCRVARLAVAIVEKEKKEDSCSLLVRSSGARPSGQVNGPSTQCVEGDPGVHWSHSNLNRGANGRQRDTSGGRGTAAFIWFYFVFPRNLTSRVNPIERASRKGLILIDLFFVLTRLSLFCMRTCLPLEG